MAELHNARHNANGKRAAVIKKAPGRVARGIRSTRAELSAQRGHIYEQGAHAPQATSKGHRGPLTRAEIMKIKELKAAGYTHLKVAEEMGISTQAVSHACVQFQIPSANKARGGWAAKKERDVVRPHSGPAGRADLLAAHDAGVCGGDCRLGRHGIRR